VQIAPLTMTRNMTDRRSESLRKRANTVSEIALASPLTDRQAGVLYSVSRNLARQADRFESPVAELAEDALDVELKNARRLSSVRRRHEVFLPSWAESCTALPNCLLRSSFWSASSSSKEARGSVVDADMASDVSSHNSEFQGVRVTFSGERLGWFDRRVLAVCIDQYREGRPLSAGARGEKDWIEMSFFQFATRMGVQYSPSGHIATKNSLRRLSSTSLSVKNSTHTHEIFQFLEVSFGEEGGPCLERRASDRLRFRILAPLANLYGSFGWTAVPHSAMNIGRGLKTWIACFYASHSAPFPLDVSTLHRLSGSSLAAGAFLANVRTILEDLKTSKDEAVAVESFHIAKTKKTRVGVTANSVTVSLKKWGKKK